jgi:ribose transport system ATP-binding protein
VGELLRMAAVSLAFGETQALADVGLSVQAGEVHALVGENGAGKSSLMRVLSGALRPDRGSMTFAGEPYAPAGPLAALRQGVAMIYQELTVLPHLTVAENIALGSEPRGLLGFVARARRDEHAR